MLQFLIDINPIRTRWYFNVTVYVIQNIFLKEVNQCLIIYYCYYKIHFLIFILQLRSLHSSAHLSHLVN